MAVYRNLPRISLILVALKQVEKPSRQTWISTPIEFNRAVQPGCGGDLSTMGDKTER